MSFHIDASQPDDLGRDLERAAPHVTHVGAWEAIQFRARSIRRRRRTYRVGVSVLLATMLVGAGVYLAQLRPTSPGISETELAQPDPGTAAIPPAPESPTATVIPQGDPDPRAVAVRDWIQALQTGDLEAGWELLDTRAQNEYGTQDAFNAASAGLSLRWGAWGRPESWSDLQLVDLGLVEGERLAVVTVFGLWSSGTYAAPRADALLVVSRPIEGESDGAGVSRVDPLRLLVAEDPSESALVDEGKVLAFEIPSAPGVTLSAEDSIWFAVPHYSSQSPIALPAGDFLTFLDGTVADDALLSSAEGGRLHGVHMLPRLPAGRHVVTVVFVPEDGSQMSAAASFFLTGTDGNGPSTSTTAPSTDVPPLSEASARAVGQAIDALLHAVLVDDRASFVSQYASTDRPAAERIFDQESARIERLGSRAYDADETVPIALNWIVGTDWAVTWTPLSPSPELGAWIAADPHARVLASVTTVDGVTRFLPFDVDGDTVYIHVLGGDPGMEALGAFDLLGRTPSDVVAAYFAALRESRYDAAWELLSDSRPSLHRFFAEEGAATATADRHEAGQYVILDNGDAWVDVTVLSPPDYSRKGVPVTGRWLCVRQDGEWRLDHAVQQLTLP